MLDRTTPPPVFTIGDLSLPTPSTITLANGIKLLYLDGGSLDVCQLDLVWQGGIDEAPTPSIVKIMAPMMREGTSARSSAEISESLDFNGAMLKIGASPHHTSLALTALNSKMPAVLPVVHDMVTDAIFDAALFEKQREIVLQNHMLAQSKVMTLSNQACDSLIKGADHPQAHVPTADEILAVTRDQVREYYQRVVASTRCTAYLSGRITPVILNSVKSLLESLPGAQPLPMRVVPNQAQQPQTVVVDKPNSVQAAVSMGIPAIMRNHPDYVPLRFTVMALGGYFGSRLMKNIREDKGYTYGIVSYLAGAFEGSASVIMAQTDQKYVEPLISEVRSELTKMVTQPLDDAELMRLRQYISTTLIEHLDSPFAIMDYYKTIQVAGIPDGYFDSQVAWAHKLNAATISEMSAKYLQPEQLRIAVCR